MSLKSNRGLLSLMRCMDVLRHAGLFWKETPHFFLLLPFFFFFFLPVFPVLASETTRGQFPSASCVGHRNRGQDREITLPPPFPVESITQTTLLMAKQHCFRVLLLIDQANDVESFKTNGVFCVWWLNYMDFSPLWSIMGRRSLLLVLVCLCVCV